MSFWGEEREKNFPENFCVFFRIDVEETPVFMRVLAILWWSLNDRILYCWSDNSLLRVPGTCWLRRSYAPPGLLVCGRFLSLGLRLRLTSFARYAGDLDSSEGVKRAARREIRLVGPGFG